MSAILKPSPLSSQINTVATRQAKAAIVVNDSHTPAEIDANDLAVSLVFETLAEIGMSDKEAAYTMAMDPAQLSRIKTGQARLPFDALWRLPTRFWSSFTERISESKGLAERHLLKVRAARVAELVKLLLEGVA